MSEFRTRVREIAARRGVRIAKWLGDGAMMVGVEPEAITEAIVDIEEAFDSSGLPLSLRAGLASGPVILFEGDDYIGQAVNMAARLCGLAKPGEVLATESMLTTLMVNTTATPIGAHAITGIKLSLWSWCASTAANDRTPMTSGDDRSTMPSTRCCAVWSPARS